MLDHLQKKNVHIVGVSGAEGSAVARFLSKHIDASFSFHDFVEKEKFKESFFSFHDAYSEDEKEEVFADIEAINAERHFKDTYLKGVEDADVIFVPQTWFRHESNSKLKDLKDKLTSITRLYFEIAPCKVIGVTGTAGKSTTSKLAYTILKEAGVTTILAGNERKQKQDLEGVTKLPEDGALVLEVSHRQLITGLRTSPDIAVVTNIFPHHKDDSSSFEEYVGIKKSLYKKQKPTQVAILNADDESLKDEKSPGPTYFFSISEHENDGAFVRHSEVWLRKDGKERRICDTRDLGLKGDHNVMNVLAASFAAYEFGVGTKEIRKTVTTFASFGSRMENMGKIDGVTIIDDSKGGSSIATIAALSAFPQKKVHIVGGTRKDITETEFDTLAQAMLDNSVHTVIAIGEMKDTILDTVRKVAGDGPAPELLAVDSLERAVEKGFEVAKKGEILLFSPACESFDMFKDYRARTRLFRKLIEERL